ncbi:MAG TPA: metalloregulator ArsR/SmtB family transcription factor [Casimicrobiaceae bacterium]|jgi:DNA-binding transcriptional ArsR family regulator
MSTSIRNPIVAESPAGDVFQALADPTRRAILGLLRQGSQPVGSIARDFPISRPAISKHLRILREAALVTEIKVGRQRLYAINAAPLRGVDDWLAHYRHMWQHQLRNLKRYVEQKARSH